MAKYEYRLPVSIGTYLKGFGFLGVGQTLYNKYLAFNLGLRPNMQINSKMTLC